MRDMGNPRAPRIFAALAYVFMVVMNALANTLPLNGQPTGDISAKYDTLFAPIGFTFSIWGVIYLLLGVYTVYQLVRTSAPVDAITPWFIATSVLNGTWIIAWHYEVLWAALLIIIALLVTLIRINYTTTEGRRNGAHTLAVRLPFAVYFGWVTVATVANVSALLVQWGWRGDDVLGPGGWTVAILIVAAVIGSAVALINSSAAYALVIVWAFWGILARHLSPEEWNQQYPEVILTLQILLPVVGIVALVAFIQWWRTPVVAVPSTPVWSRVNA